MVSDAFLLLLYYGMALYAIILLYLYTMTALLHYLTVHEPEVAVDVFTGDIRHRHS